MAKNQVQEEGSVLVLTAPYDTLSGAGCLVVNTFGVSLNDTLTGETGVYATEGVWELPKLSTDVFALGAPVYWDDGNKRCCATAHLNYLIGVATAAVGNPSATVKVKLDNGSTIAGA